MISNRSHSWYGLLAMLGLLACTMLAFAVGHYPATPVEVGQVLSNALFGYPSIADAALSQLILQVRGPRIGLALLIGAGLAAAGAAYQSLFRNPLVSPDLLGVSSGAALGAVAGIFLARDAWMIQVFAFVGGMLAVLLAYAVAAAIDRHHRTLVLVLCGVAISALLGAGVAMLTYFAEPQQQLPAMTFWLLGSLSSADPRDFIWLVWPSALSVLLLWTQRDRLDALAMGEAQAASLGVAVVPVRVLTIIAATLLTAAGVSVAGMIGWVGLIIPHMARLLVGAAFARVLPASLVLGGGFLLMVDTCARNLGSVELPLGVCTALVGTPIFLWLLLRHHRYGN